MKKKSNCSKTSSKSTGAYIESLKGSSSSKKETEHLWNAKDAVAYAENKLGIKLDEWQKEYIKHEGNTVVRAGRQSGKSFAESLRVALFALLNNKTSTLIIASVDRQSIELLEKVKAQIIGLAKGQIKGRPTFHKIELKNGSVIRAEPAGQTGYGLRGFTVDKLVADEAHYIPEAVFVAVQPMLATTNGTIDLLSTPRGNIGFFYDCCNNKEEFYEIHIKSEDCPRISDEFLANQRRQLTKLQYAQEYEAIFLDALQQFFPKELIDSCILPPNTSPPFISPGGRYYLGVDFAGHGTDQNAFVSVFNAGKMTWVNHVETTEDQKAWATVKKIERLNTKFQFKCIGVDDGGLGAPILDYLLKHNQLKRKTIGLNNAKRDIDHRGRTKQLKGIDMYANLKIMMEQGLLKFPSDDELIRSLTSIQFEIDPKTQNIRIHGKYDHITEGLKRAAELVKSKGLNIMAFC
jgi:hypothetical protein